MLTTMLGCMKGEQRFAHATVDSRGKGKHIHAICTVLTERVLESRVSEADVIEHAV